MIGDIVKIFTQMMGGGDNNDMSKYMMILLVTIYVLSRDELNPGKLINNMHCAPRHMTKPICNLVPLTLFTMFIGLFIYTICTFIYGVFSRGMVIDGCIISDFMCPKRDGRMIRHPKGCPLRCPFKSSPLKKCPFKKCPLKKCPIDIKVTGVGIDIPEKIKDIISTINEPVEGEANSDNEFQKIDIETEIDSAISKDMDVDVDTDEVEENKKEDSDYNKNIEDKEDSEENDDE
jgi:hypothetical protein